MTLRLRSIPKRWKPSAGLRALLASGPVRERKTEEHDAQVELFRDHSWPRLIDDAVAFAIGNGGNRARDERVRAQLEAAGWTVFEVWECDVKPETLQELAGGSKS
ncbi:hypothetical protein [Bradyrhizobium liaoningense]|uniref:hypothetical protein n=1 Tax=Bradyrhizobium liaoningense TaxID=43992 RepID=UPI001BA58C09|nr:hypothetical protein [Bradyrhizobium liaoningense]MBR0822420.1 hypothetical protein [Bradyrhizobium liaoningense]